MLTSLKSLNYLFFSNNNVFIVHNHDMSILLPTRQVIKHVINYSYNRANNNVFYYQNLLLYYTSKKQNGLTTDN